MADYGQPMAGGGKGRKPRKPGETGGMVTPEMRQQMQQRQGQMSRLQSRQIQMNPQQMQRGEQLKQKMLLQNQQRTQSQGQDQQLAPGPKRALMGLSGMLASGLAKKKRPQY